MDVPNIPPGAAGAQPPLPTAEPATIEADGRAVADVAASKRDATPEVPLPVPATGSQDGLVSAAALKDTDAAPKLDASSSSSAERTLKPYGVAMLPHSAEDAPSTGGQSHGAADEDVPPEL